MRILSSVFILSILIVMSCASLNDDYQSLHKDAFVADLHCDTVLDLIEGDDLAGRDSSGHVDIPRLKAGGVDLQVFACFIWTDVSPNEALAKVNLMIDTLETQIARNSDDMEICLTADDAERITGEGKIAAFLAVENGVAIANDLSNLDHLYSRGIRYMTLTHISSNALATSSSDSLRPGEGLTKFGREVVRKMDELGMIIDISHARIEAVEDVLEITSAPVIASHSCVWEIQNHDRNLNDDQIRAIAKNGGMIGINFFQYYLSSRAAAIADSIEEVYKKDIEAAKAAYPDDYKARRRMLKHVYDDLTEALAGVVDIGTVVDHIDYIVNLVGPDYVGLGSDFDGVSRLPEGLTDCSMIPNITCEMVSRGYSKEDIEKILGGNFLRIFRQVCG